MVMRTAERRRILRENPCTGIRKLKEPRTEIDPLSPEEVDAFLGVCPSWWRPYFTVAFWTGLRPNEQIALRWGSVDWINGKIRIRTGIYQGVEGTPKTESSVRDVDMLLPVVEALRAQRAQQAKKRLQLGHGGQETGEDYVFEGQKGALVNPSRLGVKTWYPALKKAGLARRIMYQTRHTFASNALMAGESPGWISEMLGHTTTELVFKTYARYIPNKTRRDGSAFAARMGEGKEKVSEIGLIEYNNAL